MRRNAYYASAIILINLVHGSFSFVQLPQFQRENTFHPQNSENIPLDQLFHGEDVFGYESLIENVLGVLTFDTNQYFRTLRIILYILFIEHIETHENTLTHIGKHRKP